MAMPRNGILAVALVTIALSPGVSLACEPIHTIKRIPPGTTPTIPEPDPSVPTICWAGPCRNVVGVVDSLGRIFINKDVDGVIDHIVMTMDNGPHHQVLVARSSDAICNPPVSTVAGCTERYRVKSARACPLGTAPCRSRDKEPILLTSLDPVNAHASGHDLPLGDGESVRGRRTPGYWLYYEICCPDHGQFGLPGTAVLTQTTYVTRRGTDVASCRTHQTRASRQPDEIPDVTFPCP